MSRKSDRRLSLRKESLRRVDAADLRAVHGGIIGILAGGGIVGPEYAGATINAATNWYADTHVR